MKTIDDMKLKRALLVTGAVLVGAVFSAPTAAGETPTSAYTMTVIKDEAYGNRVTSGEYEQAISKITHGGVRTRDRFADQVNLCVAYAKSKDLESANAACDAALARLKQQERRATRNKKNLLYHDYQSNLALALSNRGVLHAVSGKSERAKADFAAAIELQTRISRIARGNLERLERSALPDA